MVETFGVRLRKECHVFAAAHFITFNGNICERLHGHNYAVAVEVAGTAVLVPATGWWGLVPALVLLTLASFRASTCNHALIWLVALLRARTVALVSLNASQLRNPGRAIPCVVSVLVSTQPTMGPPALPPRPERASRETDEKLPKNPALCPCVKCLQAHFL